MFGHVFQPYGQIPRSYRRVAWLKSDGNAYINTEYAPWGWANGAEDPSGVHISINASYPSTSSAQPGCVIGSETSVEVEPGVFEAERFGFVPDYQTKNKIPDSGTVTFESWYSYYTITVTANYARDEFGTYSGTMTAMGQTFDIPSDGGIAAPYCPAQQQSETTSYTRFALRFMAHSNYPQFPTDWAQEEYTATASQMFFSGFMQNIGFSCSKLYNGYKIPVTLGTASYEIPGIAYGSRYSISMFMFAKNNFGAVSLVDANVKIQECLIRDRGRVDVPADKSVYTRRNLIAVVRNRDDKPGFYDTVSKRFFTNAASSGEFTFAELTT